MPAPAISLILIHYRQDALTAHVLQRLAEIRIASPFEVIIVDNGSPAPFTPHATAFPCRVLRMGNNAGYARACNEGARAAASPLLLFLNNDIDFDRDVITPLAAHFAAADAPGIVAPALCFPDGRFQLSWGDAPGLLSEARERTRQRQSRAGGGPLYAARAAASARQRDVDWVTGAALCVARDAFDTVGGFDEEYFFYFEDADLCARVRASGRAVRYDPAVRLVHFGGGSQDEPSPAIAVSYRMGQLRYYARHCPRISFSLLKAYLSLKIAVRAIRERSARPAMRELLGRVLRFTAPPFRP
jgi:GT2 family glycosyltransferase